MKKRRKRGRFWNQVESRDKKGEDGDIWVYMCGGEKTREKKRRKRIRNKPFRNTTTIFS